MKANYSWALSLLVLLWHTALTLRQEHFHLHLQTPFYWNQKDSIFQNLSREGWAGGWRGWEQLPHQQKGSVFTAAETALDKTVRGNIFMHVPELSSKRF